MGKVNNMRISIIGAGNIGTALACDLGRNNKVRVYSSKPNLFDSTLLWKDLDDGSIWKANIEFASDSYEKVVTDSDLILFALPTFLLKSAIENVLPYIEKHAVLGFVPGAGGVEFLCMDAVKQGHAIFGFERVPYIARVECYGRSVMASKKARYRVAALPSFETQKVCTIVEELFDRPCLKMKDFISITLTPSLHASRLYDLYKDYNIGTLLDVNMFFYAEWRDSASYLTFELDEELHNVCDELVRLGVGAEDVVPYYVHYESATPELLTLKIRSINSLKGIKGPLMVTNDGKYELDLHSRYFTESYPYRLCIVKGFALLLGIETPITDRVLKWYEELAHKEYYKEKLFTGKDVKELNIPQNYGVMNVADLVKFYT